jgi:hypothetical protein
MITSGVGIKKKYRKSHAIKMWYAIHFSRIDDTTKFSLNAHYY